MFKASTALALPLVLAATACHGGRPHHPGKMAGITDVIAVQGIGEVKARPDVARLTLGVEAQDPSASAAVESMTARMRAVIDAMKARGITEADIQTSQLSIYSEQPPHPYPHPPQPYPQAPMAEPRAAAGSKSAPVAVAVATPPLPPVPTVTYRVTNTVTVTVRKVETLGDVIGAAVGAGANHAGGIQFDVEDKKPLEDQARTKAMTDAKHRAEELARLGGVKLGPVLSVAEGDAGGDGPMPYGAKMVAIEASYSVPTESGQITARHGVSVVYRIAR